MDTSLRERTRVLVVDDHVDTATVVARMLTIAGHAVTVAHGYEHALRAARSGRHDVLITDLALSDGDGFDLLAEVRKLYPVRAVAVSGYGDEPHRRRCAEAGFDRFLPKPVAFDELETTVQTLAAGTLPLPPHQADAMSHVPPPV